MVGFPCRAASTVNDQREDPCLDSPRRPGGQRPEDQRLSSLAHHDPTANALVFEVRGEAVAIGTPHLPIEVVEPAAPHHAECISTGLKVFAPRPLLLIRRVGITFMQTPRPFPNISAHVLDAIEACPTGETSHGTGANDARRVSVIRSIRVGLAPPGIDAPSGTTCRLLPFRFARQTDLPGFIAYERCQRLRRPQPCPQPFGEPVAVLLGLVPAHSHHRVIG
jgi:hypothetical protein